MVGGQGAPSADQDWMRGGTYLVARRIRMLIESWDRASLGEQERVIGRAKESGAPLSGTQEFDALDLDKTVHGKPAIDVAAHVRLAAPDTNGGVKMLRRGYSYTDGLDVATGQLDAGLFFIVFGNDPHQQFRPGAAQARNARRPGRVPQAHRSGIFACPPECSAAAPGARGCSAEGAPDREAPHGARPLVAASIWDPGYRGPTQSHCNDGSAPGAAPGSAEFAGPPPDGDVLELLRGPHEPCGGTGQGRSGVVERARWSSPRRRGGPGRSRGSGRTPAARSSVTAKSPSATPRRTWSTTVATSCGPGGRRPRPRPPGRGRGDGPPRTGGTRRRAGGAPRSAARRGATGRRRGSRPGRRPTGPR